MMKDYYPDYIDKKIDEKIRSEFPICLDKKRMKPNVIWQ